MGCMLTAGQGSSSAFQPCAQMQDMHMDMSLAHVSDEIEGQLTPHALKEPQSWTYHPKSLGPALTHGPSHLGWGLARTLLPTYYCIVPSSEVRQ